MVLCAFSNAPRPGAEPDPEDEIFTLRLPPESPPHDSYVRLSGEAGTSAYQNYLLEPRIAFSDHWAAIGQLNYLESQPGLFSHEAIGGLEWRSRENASLSLAYVGGYGPSTVSWSGGLLDAAAWLNKLWGGTTQTVLRFEGGLSNYTIPFVGAAGVSRPGTTQQIELQLLLTQEITRRLIVTFGYTGYLYDRSIGVLNDAINNAKTVSAGSVGQVAGFPIHAWLLQVDWTFVPKWTAEISASSTVGAIQAGPAVGVQGVVRYQLDRSWLFGVSTTVTYEGPGDVDYSAGPELELSW